MSDFVSNFIKLIYRPREALMQFAERTPSAAALILLLTTLAASQWIHRAAQDPRIQKLVDAHPLLGTSSSQSFLACAVGVIFVAFQIGLLHVISELLGGQGRLRALWTCLLLVQTVTTAVSLIPVPHLNWVTTAWNWALSVLALRVVYRFRWAKALGIYILGWVALMLAGGVLGVALAMLTRTAP